MRPLIDFLGELRAKGVALTLDGDSLRCAAPPGVLDAALKAELLQQKPAIVSFLLASQHSVRAHEPVLAKVDRSGQLPLSFAQQRLWFLHQLDPESTVYNIGAAIEVTGPLDIPALEKRCGRSFVVMKTCGPLFCKWTACREPALKKTSNGR